MLFGEVQEVKVFSVKKKLWNPPFKSFFQFRDFESPKEKKQNLLDHRNSILSSLPPQSMDAECQKWPMLKRIYHFVWIILIYAWRWKCSSIQFWLFLSIYGPDWLGNDYILESIKSHKWAHVHNNLFDIRLGQIRLHCGWIWEDSMLLPMKNLIARLALWLRNLSILHHLS